MLGIYALGQGEAEAMERAKPIDHEIMDEIEPEIEPTIEAEDYEIVLGRRQLASVSFVVLVLIAIFSTVSYLAGKSFVPKAAPAPPPQIVVAPPEPTAIPQIEATITPPPAAAPIPAP